jgi:uncharacterized pyridoxal phosphate-containing UPF0001 family protein
MSTSVSKASLDKILQNIHKYSPYPSRVQIIAVTKGFSYHAILSALSNKLYCIGENRVQEFLQKKTNLPNQKF